MAKSTSDRSLGAPYVSSLPLVMHGYSEDIECPTLFYHPIQSSYYNGRGAHTPIWGLGRREAMLMCLQNEIEFREESHAFRA